MARLRLAAALALAALLLAPAAARADVARLKGLVRSPKGDPVAGAKVTLIAAEEIFRTEPRTAETGLDGVFQIATEPGSWWVMAAAGGAFAESYVDLAPGGPRGQEILVLSPGGSLAGTVAAPEGPTATANRTLRLEGGFPLEFEIPASGPFRIDGIFPHRYVASVEGIGDVHEVEIAVGRVTRLDLGERPVAKMTVRVSGLEASERASPPPGTILLPEGQELEVILPIAPGVQVRRRVTGKEGAEVAVVLPPGRFPLVGRLAKPQSEVTRVVALGPVVEAHGNADSRGWFVFPALPPGRYKVRANGFLSVDIEIGPKNTSEVVLTTSW